MHGIDRRCEGTHPGLPQIQTCSYRAFRWHKHESVRPTGARSPTPSISCGHIDMRAQAEGVSAQKSDTHLRRFASRRKARRLHRHTRASRPELRGGPAHHLQSFPDRLPGQLERHYSVFASERLTPAARERALAPCSTRCPVEFASCVYRTERVGYHRGRHPCLRRPVP
jgi:hypothetical protein